MLNQKLPSEIKCNAKAIRIKTNKDFRIVIETSMTYNLSRECNEQAEENEIEMKRKNALEHKK